MSRPVAPFSFIDLFAGIGGFRIAFEAQGGECVFTSEWDRFAVETYRANHRCDHPVAGDITQVHTDEIPEHDLLLAGFPCQPFSIAGVSKKNALGKPHGFACRAQGTLFFDVARIIAARRPKCFVLENVKHLLRHDQGRTFQVIEDTLSQELGYHIDYRVIDAQAWVPQHRERLFIVGFREPSAFRFASLRMPSVDDGPVLDTVLHPEDGSEPINDRNKNYLRPNGKVQDRYTLSDKLWSYLQAYAEKHRRKGNGFGYRLVDGGDVSRTLSARYYKDGSEILIRQRGRRNPRRLTPVECARLMGFDKLRKCHFKIPVSDNQAYRQFGNAIVVPAATHVAEQLVPWVHGELGVAQNAPLLATQHCG